MRDKWGRPLLCGILYLPTLHPLRALPFAGENAGGLSTEFELLLMTPGQTLGTSIPHPYHLSAREDTA